MAEIKEMLAGFAEVANNPKAQLDKYLAEANKGGGLKFSPRLKPYFQWVLPVLIVIILLQGLL